MNLLDSFRAARRVGTPIIAISCFDPEATMASIQAMVKEVEDGLEEKGRLETSGGRSFLIQWDVIRGWIGREKESNQAISKALGSGGIEVSQDDTKDPVESLVLAERLPSKSILFVLNSHRYFESSHYIQAIWNLRDKFKTTRRLVVLLGTEFVLPTELSQDVLLLEEALPNDEELKTIVTITKDAAKVSVDDDTVDKAVDALRGLPTFPAEQATAMCLTPEGLDVEELWGRKRSLIGQTPGLSVFKDGSRFENLGGLDEIKDRFSRIIKGKAAPKVILFIDEIEKAMAGVGTDGSGTATDQLGVLLTEMTEKNYTGALFVGPPGAAKSAFAKSVGNEAGILTIKMDLGAMKGNGLVGQAEKEIRHAMKVIEAVGGPGGAFFIATSNDIRVIKPELKRRMKKGIWYFDLPSVEERHAIWDIFCTKYGYKFRPDRIDFDTDWTGAEIENCVSTAWEEDITFEKAAEGIIPVAVSAREDIKRLRAEANGKYNSASYKGAYLTGTDHSTKEDVLDRKIVFEE